MTTLTTSVAAPAVALPTVTIPSGRFVRRTLGIAIAGLLAADVTSLALLSGGPSTVARPAAPPSAAADAERRVRLSPASGWDALASMDDSLAGALAGALAAPPPASSGAVIAGRSAGTVAAVPAAPAIPTPATAPAPAPAAPAAPGPETSAPPAPETDGGPLAAIVEQVPVAGEVVASVVEGVTSGDLESITNGIR